jgi:hypothetical protein
LEPEIGHSSSQHRVIYGYRTNKNFQITGQTIILRKNQKDLDLLLVLIIDENLLKDIDQGLPQTVDPDIKKVEGLLQMIDIPIDMELALLPINIVRTIVIEVITMNVIEKSHLVEDKLKSLFFTLIKIYHQ